MRTLTDEHRALLAAARDAAAERNLILHAGRLYADDGAIVSPLDFAELVRARLAYTEDKEPLQGAVTERRARTVVGRLTRLRGTTGIALRKAGEQAYTAALRQAGIRINTRARSRLSAGRQAAVREAVEKREPLSAWLGAVGITELELLRGSFDAFEDQARTELDRYWQRATKMMRDETVSVVAQPGMAVEYLSAGWLALARRRLLLGDAALRAAMHPGFDRQDQPGDTFAVAGARLTRRALRINEGAAHMTPGGPDDVPDVADSGAPQLEVQYAIDAGLVDSSVSVPRQGAVRESSGRFAGEVWEWVHGFYGEPLTAPFDAHDDLDGFQTSDPETDDRLLNDEAWPPVTYWQPDDHEGCNCAWVLLV